MSSDEVILRAENISKIFEIYRKPRHRLQQMFLGHWKTYYTEFWALSNINFELKKGECLGIIGRNGAGKSTLLQILTGTLTPTQGSVYTKGRIAALLELGSGFSPEFTGRENVYMNAAILGLTKKEVDACYEDILAFADIGDFIDQPVKTYSSGMMVRLAFAVQVMIEPDILIVDEALAVGDIAFQFKCMTKMHRLLERGTTILFVTHDITSVRSFCHSALYLENGHMKAFGPMEGVTDLYLQDLRVYMNSSAENVPTRKTGNIPSVSAPETDEALAEVERNFDKRVAQFRIGTGDVKVFDAALLDMNGNPLNLARYNDEVKIRFNIRFLKDMKVTVNYSLRNKLNLDVLSGLSTIEDRGALDGKAGERYTVEYVTRLPLSEGKYSISFILSQKTLNEEAPIMCDCVDNVIFFEMEKRSPEKFWSAVYLDNKLTIQKM